MLGADLVRARRRGDELQLVKLDAAGRDRALAIAAALLATARDHVGRTRDELAGALKAVPAHARDRKVCDGLRKLVEDECAFDAEGEHDAPALRRVVFERASAARRGGAFDRERVLAEVGGEVGLDPAALERALWSDLKGAEILRAAPPRSPDGLVEAWELGQAQAVLLRAVRVEADVRCASPAAYRALFRKLKFLRLLHRIEPLADGGFRIAIDGPMSLFDQVTRYGLQLALLVPALRACERWSLAADVRWGPDRRPLAFRLDGDGDGAGAEDPLPDEVQALLAGLVRAGGAWTARRAEAVLDLPGVGSCVPDLVLERAADGARVWLEVLGFWSREAVFRRIDLVRAGLAQPIVFAVSERLRVSEELLDGELPAALYVYKGALSARAVLERAERVAGSPPRPRRTR